MLQDLDRPILSSRGQSSGDTCFEHLVVFEMVEL
jgi:hypothetical protein